MQRQGRDREIEPAQPQRREPEGDAEQGADERGGGERDPERGADLAEQDADRERARRQKAGVTERDLAGIAGEQHQRERADRGQEHLAGEVEIERRSHERIGREQERERPEAYALEPRLGEREILRIAGAEIAARARAAASHGLDSASPLPKGESQPRT